jgi:hypothetical protein
MRQTEGESKRKEDKGINKKHTIYNESKKGRENEGEMKRKKINLRMLGHSELDSVFSLM